MFSELHEGIHGIELKLDSITMCAIVTNLFMLYREKNN